MIYFTWYDVARSHQSNQKQLLLLKIKTSVQIINNIGKKKAVLFIDFWLNKN